MRRAFTIASAVSLLLFVAVEVLWARLKHNGDGFYWKSTTANGIKREVSFTSRYHDLSVIAGKYDPSDGGNMRSAIKWDVPGFTLEIDNGRSTCYWTVRTHHGPLQAVTAVLPAAWVLARAIRRHRLCQQIARGLCPRCGYDLRASPERCPECEAAVEQNTARKSGG